MKPLIWDLRKNWHINAGCKYNRSRSINKILGQYIDETGSEDFSREYATYVSDSYARSMFKSRKPISVVQLLNGEFRMILTSDKSIKVIHKNHAIECWGLSYHKWKLDDSTKCDEITNDMVQHYCILLPLLSDDLINLSETDAVYALITSEWLEMHSDGRILKSIVHYMVQSNLI